MSLLNTQTIDRIYPEWTDNKPVREELFESGVLVVDKPAGISSMDVLRLLKRFVKAKKIGHGGTLDPFATGVLPVLLNSATKKSSQIMDGVKEYEGSFLLGKVYDTQDLTGNQIGEDQSIPADLSLQRIRDVAKSFEGEILQTPPKYSAIKKDGRKLYEYARKGQEIELEQRKVKVERFEILSWDKDRGLKFRAQVHKGVYLRSLIHDLGQKLEIGAVLENLKRTRVGGFLIEEAVQLSTLRFVSDIRKHLKKLEN